MEDILFGFNQLKVQLFLGMRKVQNGIFLIVYHLNIGVPFERFRDLFMKVPNISMCRVKYRYTFPQRGASGLFQREKRRRDSSYAERKRNRYIEHWDRNFA